MVWSGHKLGDSTHHVYSFTNHNTHYPVFIVIKSALKSSFPLMYAPPTKWRLELNYEMCQSACQSLTPCSVPASRPILF